MRLTQEESKQLAIDRIGEKSINTYGTPMKIIKYNNSRDMDIQFDNGFTKNCSYGNFKRGNIFNPLDMTNYKVGYYGIGKYKSSNKSYNVWKDMFKRCYDEEYLLKYTTYIGCAVCDEWYNYQNFAKWYEENYYEIENKRMEIDKDILVKGNKIYSPETCVFVPRDLNSLFIKCNKSRGDFPIGVSLHSNKNKFNVYCSSNYLGICNTPENAFKVYKYYKEKHIKEIADTYYGLIPQKLYDAMYKYEVEITD